MGITIEAVNSIPSVVAGVAGLRGAYMKKWYVITGIKALFLRWFKRFGYLYCRIYDQDGTDRIFGVEGRIIEILQKYGKPITNDAIRRVRLHWWQI